MFENWICTIVNLQTGEVRQLSMQDNLAKIAKWEKEIYKQGWKLLTLIREKYE